MLLLTGIAAALIGGALYGPGGLLFGAVLGFGAGYLYRAQMQLKTLSQRLDGIEKRLDHERPTSASTQTPAPGSAEPSPRISTQTTAPDPSVAAGAPATRAVYRPQEDADLPAGVTAPTAPGKLEQRLRQLLSAAVRFFTTGNLVVRVGVVVLFFGVAFLLRYAYENALLPIELRLAGSSAFGILLTALGWRFRARVDTYGVVLQGAGVGLLYLTIFAAARMYELLPISAAFGLLVVLAAASCVLAVLQNAQALAIFATAGGFLAPVLMSTGAGSHVALFSYYALLNAGILAMAWFRYWRWLNWIGFLFTFAIGASWGYQYYRPELFSTTEPFLLLFFLYYVGVSVLFARRQEVDLKALVDGTLVFGTPIIAFALQAALVADMPFGLAYSALGAAAFYIGLALWLKRRSTWSPLLDQSFLALGVVFATLAIPFAFDNQRFTAATWALEGAGLLWVGLRQQQTLTRAFGLLLQLAAAAAYLAEIGNETAPTLWLNSAWFGMVMLSIASGYAAWLLSTSTLPLHRVERGLRWFFLFWSGAWWMAGLLMEIGRFDPPGYGQFDANNVNENLFVLASSASFAALTLLARRLSWREALLPGFLLLPLLAGCLLGLDHDWRRASPLSEFGWIAWPAAFMAALWHLRESTAWVRLQPLWHAANWWFLAGFCAWTLAALAEGSFPDSGWMLAAWGVAPLLFVTALLHWHDLPRWPLNAWKDSYLGRGMAVMFVLLLAWLLVAGVLPADPAPLPYLVILNPLELAQLGLLVTMAVWTRRLDGTALKGAQRPLQILVSTSGFVWLNLTAARAVHYYAYVDYPLEHLTQSDAFQATVSILWTLIALAAMGSGTRRGWRSIWIAGAVLLGAVILKLFTVDLSNLGVIARIVSFLSVGVLMLLIGYLAPLPPARKEAPQ